jgi:hypothetical protein
MDLTAHSEEAFAGPALDAGYRRLREDAPGIVGSIVLHGLGAFLILFFISQAVTLQHAPTTQTLLIDVIRYGDKTMSPPEPKKSPIPKQRSAHIPVPQTTSPRPPEGVAPKKAAPEADELDAKLRGLARLKETQKILAPADNSPNSDTDATSDDAVSGDEALYNVRDFIRATVERRWSLNLSDLDSHNFKVRVHVQMNARGVVTLAEIVDQQRFKTDARYRDIAISARNAVLLSSPFALPPGNYHDGMDMTLSLNPRDTLR